MATNSNTSLNYEDIISKCNPIKSGSPAVYQLAPKKTNMGTLTRMTLGEKHPNKTNKTILLVGETGAGKSTFINALVNYAMGVMWEDDVWFQIIDEKEKRPSESQTSDVTDSDDQEKSQIHSQTPDVIVYEIFGFEDKTLPYSLTIIDTPGYGSTFDIEGDAMVSQRLLDLFCSDDGVCEINAVGLVLKSSENRLSDRMMYIFNAVMSLFGKDMEKNIVALITHSNGRTPKNVLTALKAAKIKSAKDEKNQPVHFLFDNCQDEDRTEEGEVLEHEYKISIKGMSMFADFLEKTGPQKLQMTKAVLIEGIRLTACIHNMQERIQFIELQQREIQQTQEALKTHEKQMEVNEKFTVEVDEGYKVKQPVSERRWWGLWLNYGGAVCCTVCKENCHYPCTLAWYPEHCEVMKNKCRICDKDCRESGHMKEKCCTVCTGKCPASVHVKDRQCTVCEDECCVPNHQKGKQCPVCEGTATEEDHKKQMWRYVSKTRKVQMTKEDMKVKYEKGKAGREKSTSLLETLKKNKEDLEKEEDQFLEESYQHVVKLQQIALNFDSVSTYVHLDVLIEKMKEKGETEKVQKLEEIKRQMDQNKGTKAASWYRFGKQGAAAVKQLKK